MFKTIDFWEIENYPSIIDDVFQQLIGKNVEFRIHNMPIKFVGTLGDYIVTSDVVTFIIDGLTKDVGYFFDGQIEIEFDEEVNKITVFYL